MIKRALIILALGLPGLSAAQPAEYRVISLMSQDKNGLFVLVVKATPEGVNARVQQLGAKQTADPKVASYPRELFDELWTEVESAGFSEYVAKHIPGSKEDGGAARNYIVSTSNGFSGQTYMIPKCSASATSVSFIQRLRRDLLPPDSPDELKPCPTAKPTE
jgi:hypothetical protein